MMGGLICFWLNDWSAGWPVRKLAGWLIERKAHQLSISWLIERKADQLSFSWLTERKAD